MDTGLYANIFAVEFADEAIEFMLAERKAHIELETLRKDISDRGWRVRVFAVDNVIYGYGPDQNELGAVSFVAGPVYIAAVPGLASRLIVEGFADSLVAAGCTCYWRYGRAILYRFGKPLYSSPNGVSLFRGFEVQSLYLHDPETEQLCFTLIINVEFAYRDSSNQPVNTHDLVARFGNQTLIEMRIKQGDLAPNRRINLEISRQRLMETTIPFIMKFSEFMLPCGIAAKLTSEPMRIVLSSEADSR